jgi:hypothetical protein
MLTSNKPLDIQFPQNSTETIIKEGLKSAFEQLFSYFQKQFK